VRHKLNKKNIESFLNHLSKTGNVSVSAKSAGLTRAAVNAERERNIEFASAWDEALREADDALVEEARRRATVGYDEVMVHGGKVILDPVSGDPIFKKKYSDSLMIFLLKDKRSLPLNEGGGKSAKIEILISPEEDGL